MSWIDGSTKRRVVNCQTETWTLGKSNRMTLEQSPESIAMGDSLPERTILIKQDLEPKS
jgi:hypothetical protein